MTELNEIKTAIINNEARIEAFVRTTALSDRFKTYICGVLRDVAHDIAFEGDSPLTYIDMAETLFAYEAVDEEYDRPATYAEWRKEAVRVHSTILKAIGATEYGMDWTQVW